MTEQSNTETHRPPRADARRNEDAILEAAKTVFATSGVDAPVRAIADAAGVGIATVYRRFPKRADLVAAVFRREIDACVAIAAELSAGHDPSEALERWLMRYTDFMVTKKGLSSALHSGDAAFNGLQDYFRASFEPTLAELLTTASNVGEVRKGVDAFDLLRAIGNLSVTGDDGAAHTKRMVTLLIDGLRVP